MGLDDLIRGAQQREGQRLEEERQLRESKLMELFATQAGNMFGALLDSGETAIDEIGPHLLLSHNGQQYQLRNQMRGSAASWTLNGDSIRINHVLHTDEDDVKAGKRQQNSDQVLLKLVGEKNP